MPGRIHMKLLYKTDLRTAQIFRSVGVFAGILIVLLAHLNLAPGEPGPIWMRWYLLAFIGTTAVLSSTLSWFRDRDLLGYYLFSFQLTYWLVYLSIANDFHPAYSGSLLLTEVMCGMIFREYRWLLAFFGSSFVVSLGLFFVHPGPSVHLTYFYLCEFALMAVVILVVSRLMLERRSLVQEGEKFRTLAVAAFEYSDNGILVTENSGYVLQYNPRFLEIFNLSPELMESREGRAGYKQSRENILNPDEFDRIYLESKEFPNKSIFYAFQFKDGRYIELFSRPLFAEGEHLGRIWFFKDVTEAKQKNRALVQQKLKLEKQNEALAEFAASEAVQEGDIETVIREIVAAGMEILGADRVAAWTKNEKSDTLKCLFHQGFPESCDMSAIHLQATDHLDFWKAIEGLRVLGVTDITQEERFGSLRKINEAFTERACLIIPLKVRGQVRGIISFQAEGTVRGWTSNELGFAASISDVGTSALEAELRKKAESQLADSVAILTSVFEMSGVGIAITALGGEIIDYNADFVNMWDLSPAQLQPGAELEMMAHIQDRYHGTSEIKEAVNHLFNNPDQSRVDRLELKDGRLIERTTRGLWVGGKVRGRIWYYLDITRRIRSKEALRRSERRNRAIVNAVPDLMLLLKSSGEILDRTIPKSSTLAHLFQNQANSITTLFPKPFALAIMEAMKGTGSENDLTELDLPMEIGEEKYDFEVRMVHGGEDEVLAIIRDVTLRKTTERELIQRNFELDSFVYRASHDLKAPLNSLMGIISILVQEELPPEITTYIGLMDRSVVKLDTFIRNLTDFSRITRLEITEQVVDFKKLFTETCESLMHMEFADRVDLKLELDEPVPWHGDRFHLGIVLSNLLSNAIKYQDHKKDAPQVVTKVHVQESTTRIEIEDNGIGIKAEYQKRLYELFFRASNQSFGSGLGLYITKNAVEKMDGKIQLDSVPGVGTRFTILLPNHFHQMDPL